MRPKIQAGKITTIFTAEAVNASSPSTHGGSQKGSGGAKGKKDPRCSRPHEREAAILDRITRNADKVLYGSTVPPATGVQLLFALSRLIAGQSRSSAEQVTDPETIISAFVSWMADVDEYYFYATQLANKALL